MWRLFVPLRYLRIRHSERAKFNVYVPVLLTFIAAMPLLIPAFRADAMASTSLVNRSSDLLSVLTGFFVAALAAVATFGNPEMDEPIAGGDPVTLSLGGQAPIELTRRRFLSYLFGYLAFASFAIYGLGFLFVGAQHYLIAPKMPAVAPFTFVGFWALYCFGLSNLLVNGLFGLFYLTDRIHRPNRVVTFNRTPTRDRQDAA